MVFGILKDTKRGEFRVICTPSEVREIVANGHEVLAQVGCGAGAGFEDAAYLAAGARVARSAAEIFAACDMVAKVKELSPEEYTLLRKGQILLGCLHPAANPREVDALLASECVAFTAEDSHRHGSPNCEAAGKQGALFGLESMLTTNGGKGKFVGGFAGAPAMRVLILGGGLVGQSATQVLDALGAKCTVMDIDFGVLRRIGERFGGRVETALCSREAIAARLPYTDMVLNCVKWPKERRDFLIDRAMLTLMERGSVLVDISNDAPGAIESSRPTPHDAPRYVEGGVVHFCVANIPSAVAHSSSVAYAAAMLPMILSILTHGVKKTCQRDEFWRKSLVAYHGTLTHAETALIQKRPWRTPAEAFS